MRATALTEQLFSFDSIHNVRLFPCGLGPSEYDITGIAARCDWQVLSDHDGRCRLYRNGVNDPQTIFLSLRGMFSAIHYFKQVVLPLTSRPFVLVSGSEDITLPNQLDCRWPAFTYEQRSIIEEIRSNERLIAWFAENLDELKPKMTPLPTGYVFSGSGAPVDSVKVADNALSLRPMKALCSHRVRDGQQWERRRHVTSLCQKDWHSEFTL